MAHVCPTCGGTGTVEKGIEPVLSFDGAAFSLCQGTILSILLADNAKPVRVSDLYTRYASTRDEIPQPETIKVQISLMRRRLRKAGSKVEIRQPVCGVYQLANLPADVSRETYRADIAGSAAA